MIDKDIFDYTKKELKTVPHLCDLYKTTDIPEEMQIFDSLILIPTNRKHDSGYKCMEFVAVKNRKPIYRFGGGSDVLHLDGIGGFGYYKKEFEEGLNTKKIDVRGWEIDLLPCGYFRLFNKNNPGIRREPWSYDTSDICIYGYNEKKEKGINGLQNQN